MTTPRMEPLAVDQLDDELRPMVEGRPGYNLFATLGRHPALARRFMRWGGHFLSKGALPPRERELVILRTSWNLRAAYEWGHHSRLGLGAGLTREEVDRIPAGAPAAGWEQDFDRTLLKAADELFTQHTVSDETWAALATRYDEAQLLELPLLVGQYVMVGTLLLTIGIEPEQGAEPLPG